MNGLQEFSRGYRDAGKYLWRPFKKKKTKNSNNFLCSSSPPARSQYIFSCLRNGQNPHLTVVHHSTIRKHQEEQGRVCQAHKSRCPSRPPPLPLKKVRGQWRDAVPH